MVECRGGTHRYSSSIRLFLPEKLSARIFSWTANPSPQTWLPISECLSTPEQVRAFVLAPTKYPSAAGSDVARSCPRKLISLLSAWLMDRRCVDGAMSSLSSWQPVPCSFRSLPTSIRCSIASVAASRSALKSLPRAHHNYYLHSLIIRDEKQDF